MGSRQLLVVATCLASLLGLAHWMERPAGRVLQTPFPTGGGPGASTIPMTSAAEETPVASVWPESGKAVEEKKEEGDRCTIVFIHNRKGCVFDGRAHLREAGIDAAIPNPALPPPPSSSSSSSFSGAAAATKEWGWAAAAAGLGGDKALHAPPARLGPHPKGQPYGPPQTTLWKVRARTLPIPNHSTQHRKRHHTWPLLTH